MGLRKFAIPLIAAVCMVSALCAWLVLSRGSRRPQPAAREPVAAPEAKEDRSRLATDLAPVPAAADHATDSSPATAEEGVATLHGVVTDESLAPVSSADILVYSLGEAPAEEMLVQGRRMDGHELQQHLRRRLLLPAEPRPDEPAVRTVTGPSGEYAIPVTRLPHGELRIVARRPPLGAGTERWSWSAAGGEVDLHLGPGETLAGIVLGPDGRGVARARVVASLDDDEAAGFSFRAFRGTQADGSWSGDDGRFSLSVAPGIYSVTASAAGLAPATLPGLASGTEDITLELGPGRTIAGRVVDAAGAPLAGARVLLLRGETSELGGGTGGPPFLGGRGGMDRLLRLLSDPEAVATSSDDGAFELPAVPAQAYLVHVEKPGYVPAAVPARLEEDAETTSVEVRLSPGKTIAGTVRGPDGKPVAHAFVAAAEERAGGEARRPGERTGPSIGAGAGEAARELSRRRDPVSLLGAAAAATTDPAGRFSLDTLAAGRYALSVQADGLVPERRDGIALEDRVELAIELEPGSRLEGRVVSSAGGAPVAGARINFALGDDDERSALADDEGRFVASGLYGEKLDRVHVAARGFGALTVEGLSLGEPGEAQAQEFVLDPGSTLGGQVIGTGALPVARARVILSAQPPGDEARGGAGGGARGPRPSSSGQSTTTDATGRFLFRDVGPGVELRVGITHPEHRRFSAEVAPLAPGAAVDDLVYTLSAGGRLEVAVQAASGDALAGARVVIRLRAEAVPGAVGGAGGATRGATWQPGRGMTRVTSASGAALFAGLEGGTYDVDIRGSEHRPYRGETLVIDDQVARHAARLEPENVVSGRVQDAAGGPIAGAAISGVPETTSSGLRSSRAQSDAAGAFRLGGLGDGPFRLRVEAEGFAVRTVSQVAAGSAQTIVLEALGGVAGRVFVLDTGMPVTAFQVRWRKAEREPRPDLSRLQAMARRTGLEVRGGGSQKRFDDPGGAFLVSGLEPGDYVLEVTAEGLPGGEALARVQTGAVTGSVEIGLVEGLSLGGTVVLKGTAAGVEGASVYLRPLPARFRGPPAEGDTTSLEDRREERRRSREEARDARRDQGAGALAGGEDPAALIAQAALQSAQRGGSSMAATDAAGAFRLERVPPGRYLVVASHDAYVPAQAEVAIEDGMSRTVRLELEEGEQLSGTVELPDGSAAAGALVTLRGQQGLLKRAMADGAGRYLIGGLVPGKYAFSARAAAGAGGERRRSAAVDLTIEKGTNVYDHRLEDGGR